jgi:hypothetical protein
MSRILQATDVMGQPANTIRSLAPKDIATVILDEPLPATGDLPEIQATKLISGPRWRVGDNHGSPDSASMAQLNTYIADCEEQIQQVDARLEQAAGQQRYVLEHQYYVHKRELYEYRLAMRLNQLKLADRGQLSVSYLYEPDPEIAELGFQLNQLRIKRRIFDYVVALQNKSKGKTT